MKAHLMFAAKVAVAFFIMNLILDILQKYAGLGIVKGLIYQPLTGLGVVTATTPAA